MLAPDGLRELLTTRWKATESGPFFEVAEPPGPFIEALPSDYLKVIGEFGGREGFLGDTYLRLYRIQELVALNVAYEVPVLLPEVILFGSNGMGEALAFMLYKPVVVQLPCLPLSAAVGKKCAANFTEFVTQLAETGESPERAPQAVGMEVHDLPPIGLGGSAADMESKGPVSPAKHAELCRYWNKVFRDHEALAKRQDAKSKGV